MLALNLSLGIFTLFLPLFIYRAFLWFLDKPEAKTPVEKTADTELILAQS